MASLITLYTLFATGVILVAGLVILGTTVRAALRTGDVGLWILSSGLLLIGGGLLGAGWLSRLTALEPMVGRAITNSAAAVGLVLIVFSMFTDERVPGAEHGPRASQDRE